MASEREEERDLASLAAQIAQEGEPGQGSQCGTEVGRRSRESVEMCFCGFAMAPVTTSTAPDRRPDP